MTASNNGDVAANPNSRDVPTCFFLVGEWRDEWLEASREMAGSIRAGKLKYRESIAEGIESAPAAFRGMLAGENFGKQLVHVAGRHAADGYSPR